MLFHWVPMRLPANTTAAQEIKRRTKTGCMTCRKRRIKVRRHLKLLRPSHSLHRALYTFRFAYLCSARLRLISFPVRVSRGAAWGPGASTRHVGRNGH